MKIHPVPSACGRMKKGTPGGEGTEKVSLQLFKELNLHIACILFGYVQIFCTLMP